MLSSVSSVVSCELSVNSKFSANFDIYLRNFEVKKHEFELNGVLTGPNFGTRF